MEFKEFKEKVEEIYSLKREASEAEEAKKAADEKAKGIQAKIDALSAEVVSFMKAAEIAEYQCGDVFATAMKRETIGYDDPDKVLEYLASSGHDGLIRVKRELDKKAINKAIKCDAALAEALAGMTSRKVTDYVVVTDAENHAKMLEHISSGK